MKEKSPLCIKLLLDTDDFVDWRKDKREEML